MGGGFCRSAALAASKTTLKDDTVQAQIPLIDEARPLVSEKPVRWTAQYEEPSTEERPCPYCGTLNPPDAVECGADRWNGCGAPLRGQ